MPKDNAVILGNMALQYLASGVVGVLQRARAEEAGALKVLARCSGWSKASRAVTWLEKTLAVKRFSETDQSVYELGLPSRCCA